MQFVVLTHSIELCAGLLDKPGRSKEQAVADEIREELGYDVPLSQIEFIGRSEYIMLAPP